MVRSVRIRHEYDHRLEVARESIDLLGFGQRSFREDHIEDFSAWTARGVSIRLLLLDPTFPSPEHSYATQRDCQWPSGSPHLRPSVLPAGGHVFSPLVAM
jgi:hypothetical protein